MSSMAEVLNTATLELYNTEAPATRNVEVALALTVNKQDILELSKECQIALPDLDNIGGLHLVAKDADRIVGYLWALVGDGNFAYIDFLMVHPEYRSKASIHPKKVSLLLTEGMRSQLEQLGITQYTCMVAPYKKELMKLYSSLGLEPLGKYYAMRKYDGR